MKLLLDSAKNELEGKGRPEDIQRKLDEAKSYALQLNGKDAQYFLLNAPQLYARLEELRTANA